MAVQQVTKLPDTEGFYRFLADPSLDKLELELKKQNIFDILSIAKAEIRHSNFLAWLLNPKGNHGIGHFFLRRFLMEIFADTQNGGVDPADADSINYQSVEIRREWKHIDLLIITDTDVIVIENKVDTTDHSDQLKRYAEIAKHQFPNHRKQFVYLTPDGTSPNSSWAQDIYTNYSYARLIFNLEAIMDVYGTTLNERTQFYIQDYITTIRREIMKDHEVNQMALKIYKTHKDVLDFIFENRPEPTAEINEHFETVIKEMGWVSGSRNKGYSRFTTPNIDSLIPRGMGKGWPGKESFMFECDYHITSKKMTVKSVISPGNEPLSNCLNQAIMEAPGSKKPSGKKWLVHFSKQFAFIADEVIDEDEAEIQKRIRNVLETMAPIIEKVETAILRKAEEIRSVIQVTG